MRKEIARKRTFVITKFTRSGTSSCGWSGDTAPVDSGTMFNWVDYTDGSSVANWRKKIKRGLNATSHFSGAKTTIKSTPGYAAFNYATTSTCSGLRERFRSGHLLSNMGVPSLPVSSQEDEAETKAREVFYNKYRSAQTSFRGGVAVGELAKTIKMIASPGKSLRKKVSDVYSLITKDQRKWGMRKAKLYKRNRAIQDTWLEHAYGWTPLINDIKDGYVALRDREKHRPDQRLVTASGYVVTESYDHSAVSHSVGKLSYRVASCTTSTTQVRYKGSLRLETDDSLLADTRYWGFSPSDIVPTLYELVPYSFLIDYFSNLGKVIDAVSMPTIRFGWGARTLRRSSILTSADASSTNDYSGVVSISTDIFIPGKWRSETISFVRSPVSSVPIPDLRFKLPHLTTQWVNTAALVRLKGLRF